MIGAIPVGACSSEQISSRIDPESEDKYPGARMAYGLGVILHASAVRQ